MLCAFEIEGRNSIENSVLVLFRVCVVFASGWARRSDIGAQGMSAFNAGFPVAKMNRPDLCAVWLLRQRNELYLLS